MAQPGIGNRKRYRNVNDDELSEFTPLSKRINNLHINNTIFPLPEHFLEASNLENVESSARNSSSVPLAASNPQDSYHPELSPSQNQFYYESNRLLYELYLERSRRHGSLQTF